MSRLPVLAWRVRPLAGSRAVLPMLLPQVPGDASGTKPPRVMFVPDEPRAALAAVVQGPEGPVTVISTHLSFSPLAARRQLRSVTRWARSLPGPRVLAGDLNLPGPVPGWLTGWTSLARAATYPAPAPRLQLDHLLTDAATSSGRARRCRSRSPTTSRSSPTSTRLHDRAFAVLPPVIMHAGPSAVSCTSDQLTRLTCMVAGGGSV